MDARPIGPPPGWSRRSAGRRLAGLLLACGLTGCVMAHYTEGAPLAAERVGEIQPGVTTKREILDWFGPPESYTDDSMIEEFLVSNNALEGTFDPSRLPDVVAYQFHEGRARGVLLLLFNYFRLDLEADRLVIFFDDDERVAYYGFQQRGHGSP